MESAGQNPGPLPPDKGEGWRSWIQWIQKFLGFDNFSEDSEMSTERLKRLEWELEQHLSLFKNYSGLAIQAVGIFAAVVGGILSISFAGEGDVNVKRLLLQATLIMSVIMGCIFALCGLLWFRVSNRAKWIGRRLKMIKFPDIIYLSYLLWVFAALFFVAAAALKSLNVKAP